MTESRPTFSAYGLFWQRSLWELDEYWILGWKPNYSHWREAPEEPEFILNDQAAIYILHGHDREILYVGQTGSGNSRLGHRLWEHAHSEKRDRWTHFTWFSVLPLTRDGVEAREAFKRKNFIAEFPSQDSDDSISATLNGIEAAFITLLEPRLNKQGGRWASTPKLEQWSGFEGTSNSDLWLKLEEIESKIDGALK